MGEKSRFIGEVGENLVSSVLKLIGWTMLTNIEVTCTNKAHAKKTHDIDRFTTYKCPLENETAIDIAISIKYNDVSSGFSNEFVKYADSIIKALACFKNNTQYQTATRGVYAKSRRTHHVVIWLNHSQSIEKNLVSEIGEVADSKFKGEEVVLLDNFRLTFLHDSIHYAKSLFAESKVNFVYPRTGYNEAIGGRALDGNLLPINFLASPIIPFKIITKDQKKVLLLTINEPFEEESLKRIIGLSQNLTEGWCNKVIIAYPDYQHLIHNNIKESVLLMFADNGFANMIDVQCFHRSFKSYESSLSPMVEPAENPIEFNVDTILPYGDQLRQLLNQSYIYKPDLQILLRRRGVYTGPEATKASLVPNFSKTLISPNEFEYLRKRQNTKESAEKITYENISVSSIGKAEASLKSFDVNLEPLLQRRNNGCELVDYSRYVDEEGRIRFRYKVKRQDLTKDWATLKSDHYGEVIISRQQFNSDQDGFRIDKVGTSQETKDLNKLITSEIMAHLREIGSVKKSDVSKKISSEEFTYEQITELLLSFMLIDPSISCLKFKTITDIDFKPNREVNLPEDIESLKDKVDHSLFNGTNLHEIKYVSDPKYRKMFIFANIVAEFFFQFDELKGVAKIEYGFPDLLKNVGMKEDFEFKVLEVTPYLDRNLTTRETHELKEKLNKEFSNIVTANYLNYQRKYGVQLQMGLE